MNSSTQFAQGQGILTLEGMSAEEMIRFLEFKGIKSDLVHVPAGDMLSVLNTIGFKLFRSRSVPKKEGVLDLFYSNDEGLLKVEDENPEAYSTDLFLLETERAFDALEIIKWLKAFSLEPATAIELACWSMLKLANVLPRDNHFNVRALGTTYHGGTPPGGFFRKYPYMTGLSSDGLLYKYLGLSADASGGRRGDTLAGEKLLVKVKK